MAKDKPSDTAERVAKLEAYQDANYKLLSDIKKKLDVFVESLHEVDSRVKSLEDTRETFRNHMRWIWSLVIGLIITVSGAFATALLTDVVRFHKSENYGKTTIKTGPEENRGKVGQYSSHARSK